MIRDNLEKLRKEISDICHSCGRNPDDVKLLAVSKYKPEAMVKEAFNSGQIDFGENIIQEVSKKAENLKSMNLNWHIIGSVQTNKVKYITSFCNLLHSLDRTSLADALQKRLEFEGAEMNCLIQVNTSGEESKSGVEPKDLTNFAKYTSGLDRIKVKGLMTIAENTKDANAIRDNFRKLKNLFDDLKQEKLSNIKMQELSMGMSGDYKIAIEEGATIIRIGSKIFGTR